MITHGQPENELLLFILINTDNKYILISHQGGRREARSCMGSSSSTAASPAPSPPGSSHLHIPPCAPAQHRLRRHRVEGSQPAQDRCHGPLDPAKRQFSHAARWQQRHSRGCSVRALCRAPQQCLSRVPPPSSRGGHTITRHICNSWDLEQLSCSLIDLTKAAPCFPRK